MTDLKNNIKRTDQKKQILSFREKARILNRASVHDCSGYNLDQKNFHYRWTNAGGELSNNVDLYSKVGYDIALDENNKAIKRNSKTMQQTQVLMRIPIDDYNEIQKNKLLDRFNSEQETLGDIPGVPREFTYGSVESEQSNEWKE